MDKNPLLHNQLTIVFLDGVVISLEHKELVTSLAEQHQAAPCEYQILQALCKRRDAMIKLQLDKLDESRADAAVHECFQSAEPSLPSITLDLESGDESLMTSLYSSDRVETNTKGGQLMLLLKICDNGETTQKNEYVNLFKEACEKQGIPVLRESLIDQTVQDREAATVTMLQHFMYQDRLFPVLERIHFKQQTKGRRKKDKKTRKEHKGKTRST
jgi:hypothetical protein